MDITTSPEYRKLRTYQSKFNIEMQNLTSGASFAGVINRTTDVNAELPFGSREQDIFTASKGRWKIALPEISKLNAEVRKYIEESNQQDVLTAINGNPKGFKGEAANYIFSELDKLADYYKAQYNVLEGILENVDKYNTVAKWEEYQKTKQELLGGAPINDTTAAKIGLMAKAETYLKNPTYIIIGAFLLLLVYFLYFHPTKKMK